MTSTGAAIEAPATAALADPAAEPGKDLLAGFEEVGRQEASRSGGLDAYYLAPGGDIDTGPRGGYVQVVVSKVDDIAPTADDYAAQHGTDASTVKLAGGLAATLYTDLDTKEAAESLGVPVFRVVRVHLPDGTAVVANGRGLSDETLIAALDRHLSKEG